MHIHLRLPSACSACTAPLETHQSIPAPYLTVPHVLPPPPSPPSAPLQVLLRLICLHLPRAQAAGDRGGGWRPQGGRRMASTGKRQGPGHLCICLLFEHECMDAVSCLHQLWLHCVARIMCYQPVYPALPVVCRFGHCTHPPPLTAPPCCLLPTAPGLIWPREAGH
jgi:hypothetical protein